MANGVPLITPLVLDRPTCFQCIVEKAGVTPGEAAAAVEQITDALKVYRETDRCRVCGQTKEVLSVKRRMHSATRV
jgi:hypothetical protein